MMTGGEVRKLPLTTGDGAEARGTDEVPCNGDVCHAYIYAYKQTLALSMLEREREKEGKKEGIERKHSRTGGL